MKKIIAIIVSIIITLGLVVAVSADYDQDYFDSHYTSTPYWFVDYYPGFERYHNEGSPRLVDWADIFTDNEEAEISSLIQEYSEKYGVDLVIYTDTSAYGAYNYDEPAATSWDINARDFYDYNGYGLGDNFSGSIWFICMEDGNRGRTTQGTGDIEYLFTYTTINAVDDDTQSYLRNGDYFEAAKVYIEDMDELMSKQTITIDYDGNEKTYAYNDNYVEETNSSGGPTVTTFIVSTLLALVVALIIGAGVMNAAVKNMQTVAKATTASSYVIPGSKKITNSIDHFLYKTTTRVYSPKEKSSSGGSSHSSGSSGGGGSFSGGGRGF